MNRHCRCAGVPLATLALLLAAGAAGADSFAIGARAGTTGLGLEGAWPMTDSVNLRAGYFAFDYGTDLEEEGVEYDGDLRLRNAALLADWHPFGGAFRLSAGGVQTGNKFKGSADGDLEVGDNTYAGQLDAEVSWSGFAPYLGVGFGNAMRGVRMTFSLDLGVMFTGSPDVRLDGSADDPALEAAFAEDLERERANLEDELSDAKYYPVVSLGLAYRF
jgi:hypothetical protein